MKIWIFNNYNMLPGQGGLNRHYFFAQELQKMGHEPVVFVGSHPHNTSLQMIEGKEEFRLEPSTLFPWVYVKTMNYEGSRLKQVFSMFQYYRNAKKAALDMVEEHGKPEAVLGSSAHPLAAVLAIRLGKKFDCRAIVEVRDLWPESLVAYGIAGPRNPAVVLLRRLEKWIYTRADAVIFTMEGGYDYIREQGWEREIPRSKVFYINNGVDLEAFQYNREHYQLGDTDLDNSEIFKVVYTGSIRKVNNLGLLLDVAKEVTNPRIRFLIWGDGDELQALRQRVEDEKIGNVVFKGRVEKKFVPSIVSRADTILIHGVDPSAKSGRSLLRFGVSPNKMFDALAAGKPIIMDLKASYNPVEQWNAGICVDSTERVSDAILSLDTMPTEERERMCQNAFEAAKAYDFENLTRKLISVIEG